MRYINTKTGEYGITLAQLRKRFPHTSIPVNATHVFEYESYISTPRPEASWMHIVREVTPKDGKQQWVVEDAPEPIRNERLEQRIQDVVNRRNQLLAESDWTQLADSFSPLLRQRWASYRQQLRDLDVRSGFVIWPAKPDV